MIKFISYNGDLIGLRTNENHLNFRWCNSRCKVLFSVAKRGAGAICHIASDKKGLRLLKQAIREWCKFCFEIFKWCKMIITIVRRRSLSKLLEKCDFIFLKKSKSKFLYAWSKEWNN